MVVPGSNVTAEVKRPSELDSAEVEAWRNFMTRTPHLQRAFFTHAFARACERAHGRAYVGVLHEDGAPAGFFPFQYAGFWQERIGLAERIGGALSDHSGLIARPGFQIGPSQLLRLCRIGCLFIDHLSQGQEGFGLGAQETRPGHFIDLTNGSRIYLANLSERKKDFVLDTKRRLKKLEEKYGRPDIIFDTQPKWRDAQDLLALKREQYARTEVGDPFANYSNIRLVQLLIEERDPNCLAVLVSLIAGGRILARHLGLLHAGQLSYWLPVYDSEERTMSPGRLLLWLTINAADRHSVAWIDRGEGDSQAKRDFSTGVRQFGRAFWCGSGWRSLAAATGQKLLWRLR